MGVVLPDRPGRPGRFDSLLQVSVYAGSGYSATEYPKLGDYLLPPMGIKFSDRPNGSGAFSKVALAGWPRSEESDHLLKGWCEKQHMQQAKFLVKQCGD